MVSIDKFRIAHEAFPNLIPVPSIEGEPDLAHAQRLAAKRWNSSQTFTDALRLREDHPEAFWAVLCGRQSGVCAVVLPVSDDGIMEIEGPTPLVRLHDGSYAALFEHPDFETPAIIRSPSGASFKGEGGFLMLPGVGDPDLTHADWGLSPLEAPFLPLPHSYLYPALPDIERVVIEISDDEIESAMDAMTRYLFSEMVVSIEASLERSDLWRSFNEWFGLRGGEQVTWQEFDALLADRNFHMINFGERLYGIRRRKGTPRKLW